MTLGLDSGSNINSEIDRVNSTWSVSLGFYMVLIWVCKLSSLLSSDEFPGGHNQGTFTRL